MRDEEFEWDDGKASRNLRDHDVSFELARRAFGDPNWLDVEDPDPDEERWHRICRLEGQILVVVYTERGRRARIILARRAEPHEQ